MPDVEEHTCECGKLVHVWFPVGGGMIATHDPPECGAWILFMLGLGGKTIAEKEARETLDDKKDVAP